MSFYPASDIQVTSRLIPPWGYIPNTSIQSKPLMIYHGAFNATAAELTQRLETVGEVMPQWIYTMYSQTHFHSTTNEVLAVVAGRARLCFGGEGNPDRFEPTVRQGDLIIVPAGVGHRLLNDEGDEPFKMVGSYPHHKQWDMCYGQPGEEEKVEGIRSVAWFHRDPLYGDTGPVLHV
ncbi:RmlC-like cupin domain-containing protein [Penicillium capsulatum]|uniref:RmlC-like cupin domain-containing protein n=1 Tax=Penicillium capsulatum TaxID=69766 RepID=A0A9W9LKV4_9EURO|nr:RmlC-like cupin domain-containing protein [Penicillium capsulatum]KAJ6116825.1 RmlC-like cupin domain-containing protein [Penicillium capsulatum]